MLCSILNLFFLYVKIFCLLEFMIIFFIVLCKKCLLKYKKEVNYDEEIGKF